MSTFIRAYAFNTQLHTRTALSVHIDYCEVIWEWHLSLSLYKQKAFVTCSITELEPLPIYPFHWTADLQSIVHNTTSLGKDAIINVLIWENNDIRGFGYQQFMLITVIQITMMS